MNTDKAKEYLLAKGLLKTGFSKFIVRFSDNNEVDFVELMSDFSEKLAQEFSEWCGKKGWTFSIEYQNWYSGVERKTTSELWQLFEKEREGK